MPPVWGGQPPDEGVLTAVPACPGVVGLVRPWAEQVGPIRVPRWLPVVLGTLGGAAVTYLFTVTMTLQVLGGARPDQGAVHGGALAVMVACYLPLMLLWGPLTLTATAGYARRRAAAAQEAARAQKA